MNRYLSTIFLIFALQLTISSIVFAAEALIIGADLSYLPLLEHLNTQYSVQGVAQPALNIFRDNDFQLVRLRLWHSPEEAWQSLDSTLSFAVRCKDAGFKIMLDLHYSDTWADPANQTQPAIWQNLNFALLVDSVYRYTNEVIANFRAADVLPEYIQIGNEITPGFLWDEGKVGWQGSYWDTEQQWDQFTELLQAGIAGALDSLPPEVQPQIILHITTACDNQASRWWLDNVIDRGVEFDIIGFSYYPWWHGTMDELEANTFDLAYRYGKYIQIVESSYPWTLENFDSTGNFVWQSSQLASGVPATPEGQLQFFLELYNIIDDIPGSRGNLLCFWEPEWIVCAGAPDNPCDNLTLFDNYGGGLPALGLMEELTVGEKANSGNSMEVILSLPQPNPFNSTIMLSFTLDSKSEIDLQVYDVLGRNVAEIFRGTCGIGEHRLQFEGSDLTSGVYYFVLKTPERREIQPAILIK